MGVFAVNRILKNLNVIFATLILLLGAVYVAVKEASTPLHFRILNESVPQNISVFDGQDGNLYIFIPSYSSMDRVQAIVPDGQEFFLDDIRLTDEMTCEVFEKA